MKEEYHSWHGKAFHVDWFVKKSKPAMFSVVKLLHVFAICLGNPQICLFFKFSLIIFPCPDTISDLGFKRGK